jgi:hypothetical protein
MGAYDDDLAGCGRRHARRYARVRVIPGAAEHDEVVALGVQNIEDRDRGITVLDPARYRAVMFPLRGREPPCELDAVERVREDLTRL